MATIAATIAGTTAAAAYLDAKYHISKDVRLLTLGASARYRYTKNVRLNRTSCFYFFENAVRKHPKHVAIWSHDSSYTSEQVFRKVCQYASFLLGKDIKPGMTVALYLRNSPEFVFVWLALWAIGCAPAMINFNLAGDSLLHCLKLSKAPLVLIDEDADCQQRLRDLGLAIKVELNMDVLALDEELRRYIDTKDALRPSDDYRENVKDESASAVFYSSGTTGLPKGMPFTTMRMHGSALLWCRVTDIKSGPGGDVWYNCMPMYHATGGHSAIACIMNGVTLAVGKKFSVKEFWNDIRDSRACSFTYVGEMARYLLAAPPSPLDKVHNVRCMYGNGLRPDVWTRFRERFGISDIIEIFNSSEGMLGLMNWNRGDFSADCVGHHGLLLRYAQRNILVPVEINYETDDLIRDPQTGLVKRRPYDEGGEILVKVASESDFPGYWNNPKATKKKFVHNVLSTGDTFYRTGDALRRDRDGRWYFMDRLGDTYRWKSENVSTAEVAQTVGQFPGVLEAIVYGVQLPGHEGRAGCAALSIDPSVRDKFDWRGFLLFARERLPRYAVPIFIRLLSGDVGNLAMHNYKQDKKGLQAEGVDPSKKGTIVSGGERDIALFLKPDDDGGYRPFGQNEWRELVSGMARL